MSVQKFHDALINLEPINLLDYQEVIPEFQLMSSCEQEPKHHAEGNVLIHANMAMQQVLPLLAQIDNQEDKIVTYIATMCHDFGKKATFAISPKHGRITAYGHDKAGVPIANEFLKKYFPELSYKRREQILRLIEFHMQPRMMMKDGTSDKKLKLMSLAVNTKLLCFLSIADTLGRVADDMRGCELLEKFKAECERLNIWGKPYVIPDSWWVTHHGYSQARWDILANNEPETRETLMKAEDLIQKAIPRFQLLMLVGPAGSGKTFERNQLLAKYPAAKVISMDERRKEVCGDVNDQSKNAEVFDWQVKELSKAMRNRESVILDSTNLTRKRRKLLWQIARRQGAVVGVVYFDLPLQTLLERNASREKKVPENVVIKQFNMLESITPEEADGLRVIDR